MKTDIFDIRLSNDLPKPRARRRKKQKLRTVHIKTKFTLSKPIFAQSLGYALLVLPIIKTALE